jgi:tetratricopeptide (TPR) repeat protein
MRVMRSFLTILTAAALVGGVVGESAHAQSSNLGQAGVNTTDPALQAQIDAAFKQVLAHPADVDLTYKYAQLLIQAGSYEPAAGALERILVVDSNQPVVRLELGVLYYRLGAYALAQAYLQQAAADPGLTNEERGRANSYLAAIEKRSSLNRYAGSISGGMRYQSNAPLASYNNIFFGGTAFPPGHTLFNPSTVPGTVRPKHEWNPFLLGDVTDSYDLQTTNEAAIVSTLNALVTRQIGDKSLSVSAAEATIGPSFKPFRVTLPALRVRAYGIVGASYLDDQFFSDEAGVGASASYEFNDRFAMDAAYEWRYENFHNVGAFLNALAIRGDYHLFRVRGAYQFTPAQSLALEADVTLDEDRFHPLSNSAIAVSAVYRLVYASPLPAELPAAWNVSVLAGTKIGRFHAGNPNNDPSLVPDDRLYTIGVTNREPLGGSWLAFQQLQYDHNASNIPNDNFNNKTFLAGLTWSF